MGRVKPRNSERVKDNILSEIDRKVIPPPPSQANGMTEEKKNKKGTRVAGISFMWYRLSLATVVVASFAAIPGVEEIVPADVVSCTACIQLGRDRVHRRL